MNDRRWLLAYLVGVVTVGFIHDPQWLAALLAGALIAAGQQAPRVLRRALLAVLAVNLAVSSGYVALSYLRAEPWTLVVIRLNLRVLLLTVMTLLLAQRVNLVRALGVTPELRFLAVIAVNQIALLRRLIEDYRQAFHSRNALPPGIRDRYRSAGRQASALMDKATAHSEELSQGMRSRGVFDDRA